jgi:hypothetical protein
VLCANGGAHSKVIVTLTWSRPPPAGR